MIEYLIPFIVGILWGSTNYLVERFYNESDISKDANIIERILCYVKNNKLAIVFFILNQLGSILFYFSLGKISMMK
jgi:hypothetical protein